MTQPSVSAAVNALERELGVTLTERAGRTVRPTAAGETYAPYAADVLGLLEQGAHAAPRGRRGPSAHPEDQRRDHRRRVPRAAAAPGVPRAAAGGGISLDVGNREVMFQRVLDHKVDVAVTGRIPDDDRFHGVDFADNEFVLITAAGDSLARRRWVAIEELAARPWLLREPGSGTRTLVEEFLVARGIEPTVLTLGSNGAIKQAARAGLGIALQSRAAVELELELGLVDTITPSGGLPERRWHVVRSAIETVREDAEAFMAFCTSPAARHVLAG